MHMEIYHEVFNNHDIILALNFLRKEETVNIINAVEFRIKKAKQTGILVKNEIGDFLDPDFDIVYEEGEASFNDVSKTCTDLLVGEIKADIDIGDIDIGGAVDISTDNEASPSSC